MIELHAYSILDAATREIPTPTTIENGTGTMLEEEVEFDEVVSEVLLLLVLLLFEELVLLLLIIMHYFCEDEG